MSKLSNSLIGLCSFFTMNSVLTSCEQPVLKKARVHEVTYAANKDHSFSRPLADTLFLTVDTNARPHHEALVKDTVLAFHNNQADLNEDPAYFVAAFNEPRTGANPPNMSVAQTIYEFNNQAEYQKLQDSLEKHRIYRGQHWINQIRVARTNSIR